MYETTRLCRWSLVLLGCILCGCGADETPRSGGAVLAGEGLARIASAAMTIDWDAVWPGPNAKLRPPALPERRKGSRSWRVFIDAGHGAPSNSGAPTAWCETEAEVMLRASEELARRLTATGRFRVKTSRAADQLPRYPARIERARAWRADVVVSLHGDYRGAPGTWEPASGTSCPRNDEAPGFSVLWSDEAEADLQQRRVELARAIALRMRDAGFVPYPGVDYGANYDGDEVPGVFVSRHPKGRRIFVLRSPKVPSVIVETHHLLDVSETTRWKEPRTHDAFGAALAAALLDFLEPAAPPPTATTAARP